MLKQESYALKGLIGELEALDKGSHEEEFTPDMNCAVEEFQKMLEETKEEQK